MLFKVIMSKFYGDEKRHRIFYGYTCMDQNDKKKVDIKQERMMKDKVYLDDGLRRYIS